MLTSRIKMSFRLKNSGYRTSLLIVYPDFIKLIKTLPFRNIIVVKPRDLCIYLDICEHHKLTWLGRLLSFLEKQGLARRHNNNRPTRYGLSRIFDQIRLVCRIDEKSDEYCVEKGCSLLGICPYWVIKNAKGDK